MSVYEEILKQRRDLMRRDRQPACIELGADELQELMASLAIEPTSELTVPTEKMWAGWFPSTTPGSFPIYLVPQSGVRVLEAPSSWRQMRREG